MQSSMMAACAGCTRNAAVLMAPFALTMNLCALCLGTEWPIVWRKMTEVKVGDKKTWGCPRFLLFGAHACCFRLLQAGYR